MNQVLVVKTGGNLGEETSEHTIGVFPGQGNKAYEEQVCRKKSTETQESEAVATATQIKRHKYRNFIVYACEHI